MHTLYLLRHGDYENPRHVLPSRLPGFPLSALGRQQIQKAARYLKDRQIKEIYASPILRTKQSARIVSEALGLPVVFSKSLLEVYSPPLQGRDEAITRDIERSGDTFRFPPHVNGGGETYMHIYRRMRRIFRRAFAAGKGNAVFIGHGDILMVFSLLEQGKSLEKHPIHYYATYIPKGGMIRMDYEGGKLMKLKTVNYS